MLRTVSLKVLADCGNSTGIWRCGLLWAKATRLAPILLMIFRALQGGAAVERGEKAISNGTHGSIGRNMCCGHIVLGVHGDIRLPVCPRLQAWRPIIWKGLLR